MWIKQRSLQVCTMWWQHHNKHISWAFFAICSNFTFFCMETDGNDNGIWIHHILYQHIWPSISFFRNIVDVHWRSNDQWPCRNNSFNLKLKSKNQFWRKLRKSFHYYTYGNRSLVMIRLLDSVNYFCFASGKWETNLHFRHNFQVFQCVASSTSLSNFRCLSWPLTHGHRQRRQLH